MKTAGFMLAACCYLSAVNAQQPLIGTVDTIGGTYIDDLTSGPAWRMLVSTPGRGIHAIWMHSADTSGSFLDRNMRYNFYDDSIGAWKWAEGIDVFQTRTGYGSIDIDTNGVAVISAHHATGGGTAPIIARDEDVGYGLFDYAPGEPALDGYLWPCVGVGMNGYYHLAMMDVATNESLYWGRLGDSAVKNIPPPQPEPRFPTHNIATSKVPGSNKVCITWVAVPGPGYEQMPGFYRESHDGGAHWDNCTTGTTTCTSSAMSPRTSATPTGFTPVRSGTGARPIRTPGT
jgi:hypothetical protein